MSALFEPVTLKGITLRNRIVASPMCQYQAHDGFGTAGPHHARRPRYIFQPCSINRFQTQCIPK
ncbi:hypothetical protein [Pseudomonas frederiksbergensis]|uniref:NADPH dehydrogenase n=1 Tax=Pseudomonas frederiksbergensis TaxID=104087 RepID=A0A6L5C6U4_9PSED|nr:NADPH dehydrogenase [Pseudomonas frederiksbergensis]